MAGPISIKVDRARFEELVAIGDPETLFLFLVEPLHEALYRHGSFELYDEMSFTQQMLLALDYLRMQTAQGGFIQFLNNGYVSLLPDLIGGFTRLGEVEVAGLLDDVLKVYVLNKAFFDKAESVEEFAKLYDELKEFEILDSGFESCFVPARKRLLEYSLAHMAEVAVAV